MFYINLLATARYGSDFTSVIPEHILRIELIESCSVVNATEYIWCYFCIGLGHVLVPSGNQLLTKQMSI